MLLYFVLENFNSLQKFINKYVKVLMRALRGGARRSGTTPYCSHSRNILPFYFLLPDKQTKVLG